MTEQTRLGTAYWGLKVGLGATAFVAGADKFFNLLVDWEKYLAPEANSKIPLRSKNFMRLVGVVEMLVGAGILTNRTQLASYAAAGWLAAIAGNLIMNEDYDIAARDVNMAVAALALAQLSAIREQQREEDTIVDRQLGAA